MADTTTKHRRNADALFKQTVRDARERDRSEALAAYELEAASVREKSARLRELRLAKEAAERETASAAAPKKVRARKA
ncbi:hypothetical protein [Propylenella binzhouense]|uniref:Uncharacterized protein n=1 Tax=Propylenella binzhouense TaxID=2555902 RepID=A0A964WTK5_9HYPH|nr:hypothetical protein [Propylenella binzhouense]MYZ48093.1 hypothetical protein [Propylenella binzhouense]